MFVNRQISQNPLCSAYLNFTAIHIFIVTCQTICILWTDMNGEGCRMEDWRILWRAQRASWIHAQKLNWSPIALATDEVWGGCDWACWSQRYHYLLYSIYRSLPDNWPLITHTNTLFLQLSLYIFFSLSYMHTYTQVIWEVTLEVVGCDRKSIQLIHEGS